MYAQCTFVLIAREQLEYSRLASLPAPREQRRATPGNKYILFLTENIGNMITQTLTLTYTHTHTHF